MLQAILSGGINAQYHADFQTKSEGFFQNNLVGWTTVLGDGFGIFTQGTVDDTLVLSIDSRKDERNIWYAFIHQSISDVIETDHMNRADFKQASRFFNSLCSLTGRNLAQKIQFRFLSVIIFSDSIHSNHHFMKHLPSENLLRSH